MKKVGAVILLSLCYGAMMQSGERTHKRKEHPQAQALQQMQDSDKKIRRQDEDTSQDSKEFWTSAEYYLKQKDRNKQIDTLVAMNFLLKVNPAITSYPCVDVVTVTIGEKAFTVEPCYPLSFLAYLACSRIPQDKIITHERRFFEAVVRLDDDHGRRVCVIGYGILWNSPYLVEHMTQVIPTNITRSQEIMGMFITQCQLNHMPFSQSRPDIEKLNAQICTLLLEANADLSGATEIAPFHLDQCQSCQLIVLKKNHQASSSSSRSSSLSSSSLSPCASVRTA